VCETLQTQIKDADPVVLEETEWLLNLDGSYDQNRPFSLAECLTWNVEEYGKLLEESRELVNEHFCKFGDPWGLIGVWAGAF
jgi:hypothetical protein